MRSRSPAKESSAAAARPAASARSWALVVKETMQEETSTTQVMGAVRANCSTRWKRITAATAWCLKLPSTSARTPCAPLPWTRSKVLCAVRRSSTPATSIEMPVGDETLGRIMNVIGEPVDEAGPMKTKVDARHPPGSARIHRAVDRSRNPRDRHQGRRPAGAIRQGRQDRPVRRRRRRQDRAHHGAHQQHRQGRTAAIRCSPVLASAPARATTSTGR